MSNLPDTSRQFSDTLLVYSREKVSDKDKQSEDRGLFASENTQTDKPSVCLYSLSRQTVSFCCTKPTIRTTFKAIQTNPTIDGLTPCKASEVWKIVACEKCGALFSCDFLKRKIMSYPERTLDFFRLNRYQKEALK